MTMQLPPLPEQEKRDLPIGDTVYVIRAYSEESMQAYATLACKERDALIGELAQALAFSLGNLKAFAELATEKKLPGSAQMITSTIAQCMAALAKVPK